MRDLKEILQTLKLEALADLISSKSKSADDHEFPMSVISADGITLILEDCTNKILEIHNELDDTAKQDTKAQSKEA